MRIRRPLRILSLEDDPGDTSLIQELLETEDIVCEITRVDTQEAFVTSLERQQMDLILADYTLPSFDGLSALTLAIDKCPDVPFIFVSGTLGEEVAIEALKIGATDYILKTRLSRLVPSLIRALREAKERAERRRAEDALRRSETFLAEAQRLSRTGSFGWNVFSGEIYWSDETFRIFDCAPETAPSVELVVQRTHPEDRGPVSEAIRRASAEGRAFDLEHRLLMPDGCVKYIRVVARPSGAERGGALVFVGAVTDITEVKCAGEALRRSEAHLLEAQRVSHTGSWIYHVLSGAVTVSPEVHRIYGIRSDEEHSNANFYFDRIHPDERQAIQELFQKCQLEKANYEGGYRIILPDGAIRHQRAMAHPVLNQSGELVQFVGTVVDDTEQWQARVDLENAFEEIKRLKDRLHNENVALREEIDRSSMFEEIVGESRVLQAVLARVAKVAPTDSTVLITGETGTGKELIARAIHKRSHRADRAFVTLNCAAVPPSLIASELFGHEKGAFTGATQRRLGRFELAEGGTIFLDEIGELSPENQIALLRVLQEREFERVGGSKTIRANVRVIAATNRDFQDGIDAGSFRSDLYYRLNVFPIEMPPLRERREDIPLLVEYFIDRYAKKTGMRIHAINRATLERLKSYEWPGNIRELQNVIERSIIVCETENFTVDESWLSHRSEATDQPGLAVLRMPPLQEKKTIEAALADARGRVSGPAGAAAKLGIPPSTLDSKIKTLKIDKNRFKTA
jgi:PAS domain S-box-containing protein